MLHYGMMRKYTLALLSTFNDIEVIYPASNGIDVITKKIPIKYSSREKSTIFSEHEAKLISNGNVNVLPRMTLSLSTIQKSDTRITNKFTKHNIKMDTDTGDFNYNSVPYEFMYDIIIQCRGMNEASMIIEQILPRFNPSYTIRVNEVPNAAEATSIPVTLLDISIDNEEYETTSTNIVTIDIGLSVKGNIFPPSKTLPKIKNLKIYNNLWSDDEFSRASLLDWDVIGNVTENNEITHFFPLGKNKPVINDILITQDDNILTLTADFEDKDNKESDYGGWIYVWSVISGSANITTGTKSVLLTINNPLTTVSVQLIITDIHGNQSEIFTKCVYNC